MRTLQYHSKACYLQIRKLYEPAKYESALIHPVFLEYFHRNVTELSSSLPYICAIGFEPNPNHEPMLKSKNFKIGTQNKNHNILSFFYKKIYRFK